MACYNEVLDILEGKGIRELTCLQNKRVRCWRGTPLQL